MCLRTVIIVLAISFWPCLTNMIYFLSFQFDALCVCWFWYTMQPYSVISSIVCLRFSVPLLISFYSCSFLFFWANPCTRVRSISISSFWGNTGLTCLHTRHIKFGILTCLNLNCNGNTRFQLYAVLFGILFRCCDSLLV
jgi:hypothetical protein